MANIELRVVEKHLDRRLNHSDFESVCRTDYAMGVITDFEKVADDPIEVRSRVKVRIGDGEESDFIPIFYHPREKYWDGPDYWDSEGVTKATDFNTEGKYFEKAWRSFRCGDKAIVALQAPTNHVNLKPVAVLGFADTVPRVGEAIIKHQFTMFDGTTHYYYQKHGAVDPYGQMNIESFGPDLAPLQLVTEAEEDGGNIEIYAEGWRYDNEDVYGVISSVHETGGNAWDGTCYCINFSRSEAYYYEKLYVGTKRLFVFVGPICFCFQFYWTERPSVEYNKFEWDGCSWVTGYATGGGDCPSNASYSIVTPSYSGGPGNGAMTFLGYGTPRSVFFELSKVTAAICSKEELLEILESHRPKTPKEAKQAFDSQPYPGGVWWEKYPGFTEQSFVGSGPSGTSPAFDKQFVNYNKQAAYIRPHTKEELIAANIWPMTAEEEEEE